VPYKSPFEPALLKRGAVFGLVGDVSVALRFGDTAREYAALRGACALVDLPWRAVFEMTGRDRVRFLHGMCTNDIKNLKAGEGCMAAVVNRQGKMVSEMVVRATESSLLIEVDRSNLQGTIDALQKFVVADDVAFRPTDVAVLGLYGPQAVRDETPPWSHVAREGVIASRHPVFGLDLLVPATKPDHAELKLAQGVPPAGFEAYEALRIERGWPRWGADMGPDHLPMEAGLEPIAISYTKGCYIGQEVIQRVKTYSEPPKTLVQIALDGAEVALPGTPVIVGGETVGNITSAALSPVTGRALALGYVRKEHKSPGTRVTVGPDLPAVLGSLSWQSLFSGGPPGSR
jgi:folate-binding protein YgfZ